jgi:hypothetical protein
MFCPFDKKNAHRNPVGTLKIRLIKFSRLRCTLPTSGTGMNRRMMMVMMIVGQCEHHDEWFS